MFPLEQLVCYTVQISAIVPAYCSGVHPCKTDTSTGFPSLCALLTGIILKGLNLRKFVFDVDVFCCFMFVYGLVSWTDMGKSLYVYERILSVRLLMIEFCPEVTRCGWHDVKIQLLTSVGCSLVKRKYSRRVC